MKNVVITGSTRGLGLAMAREFLKAGCNVTISGSKPDSFNRAKEELKEFEKQLIFISCNVRAISDIKNLWIKSAERWGGIDVWINNAGQNCPREFMWDTEESYIDAVVDTNIKGVMYGSKVAVENMLKQGHGQVWNMEGLGSNDMIIEKTILYGTSKRALTYFTKSLAKELKDSPVKVGRLSPGMMLTEFITKSPTGEPSSVTEDNQFKKIFNILADKPEAVAKFFIPRILANTKQDAHLEWLTNVKSAQRFMMAPFKKRKLI
ncbi:SDR family oxidoreductase [Clostridium swellfunianum]|uniref:SDR family oxidoreductase n=1 Tax=Clostridium swellfunianum TaxID=1367462 RepID=UPI00202EBBFB|nr:SDR family oxidoreductase [Clostridium swellfunianum]MCM0648042.1 SDR family oxidoreductase [Clostridium swellfunianum]